VTGCAAEPEARGQGGGGSGGPAEGAAEGAGEQTPRCRPAEYALASARWREGRGRVVMRGVAARGRRRRAVSGFRVVGNRTGLGLGWGILPRPVDRRPGLG
jgi:hypothetical protein